MKKSLAYIYSLLVIVLSATIAAIPESSVVAATATTAHSSSIDSIPESSIGLGIRVVQEIHDEFLLKAIEARERLEAEVAAAAKQEAEEAKKSEEDTSKTEEFYWDGEVITPVSGVANGPSGYETYYNLPMGGVVAIMRDLGYSEEEYPYWERDDGAKMLGDYIMVAANLDIRPKGTILPCSLGKAIVCDTGTFAQSNPYQLDIAVNW